MQYLTRADRAALKPGSRVYAAGFRTSDANKKIMLDFPPGECEICCCDDENLEVKYRTQGGHAGFIARIKDGKPDFNDIRVIGWCVDISDSLESARAAYDQLVKDAINKARKTAGQAQTMADELLGRLHDRTSVPCDRLIAMFDSEDGTFDTIIRVAGYDGNFSAVINSAWEKYNASDEEFYELLVRTAKDAGYTVTFPDFERITC